MTVMSV